MEIEEVRRAKKEAEDKILKILVELHKETNCFIYGITIDDIVMTGIEDDTQVFNSVNLELKI